MRTRRSSVAASVMAAALGLVAAQTLAAATPPVLTISDGLGDSVTVDASGAITCTGSCTTTTNIPATAGQAGWGGTLGPFTIPSLGGISKPVTTGSTINLSGLVETGATGGTLTISFTDNNFSGLGPVNLSAAQTVSGSVTATYSSFVDSSNALFGTGTPVATIGPLSGTDSQTATGSGPSAEPYSMTNTITVTLGANSAYSLAGFQAAGTPPPALQVACAASSGQVGVHYDSNVVASGGYPPYSYSITGGSLPPGLNFNTTTGEISGTPTTAGPFNFTVQVTDSSGNSVSGVTTSNCGITITSAPPPPLQLTCAASTGQVGVKYSSALVATGGTPQYSFAIITGSLPPGLQLNTATGAITGIPTTAGTYNFTAQVTDSTSGTALVTTSKCSITVAPAPLTLQCAGGTGQVGAAYSSALVASGGTAPYKYAIISGSLPPGLNLNSSTGAITGTPTTAGTYNFTAQVTDSTTGTALVTTSKCSIVISCTPLVLKCASATGQVGVSYNSALVASGGSAPYKYAIISGSLPPGLNLDASTGAITGTPTTAGTYNFTAQVTDSSSGTALVTTSKCSVVISCSPLALKCASSTGQVGTAYNSALVASGGSAPYKYAIISGSLPPGLNLNASTGAITGTPTTAGTYTFTAQVTDSSSGTALVTTSKCSIVISGCPAPPLKASCGGCSGRTNGEEGKYFSEQLSVSGGKGPYTFSIVSGSLPGGLWLNTSTGEISGTPNQSGTFYFTFKVKDANGSWDEAQCSITIIKQQRCW